MKKIVKYIIAVILIVFLVLIVYLVIDLDKNKIDFYEVNIEIQQNSDNYIVVKTAEELIRALEDKNIHIIEIENNIDVGYNLIKNIDTKCIKEHNTPLTHPVLKQTGVSKLILENRNDLIIFSKNGSKLLHTNIVIENSKNIKIENIKMEELWEWDEETLAEYDRNDWDYITIKSSENIQIKNCEFSKCYDGITDISNSKNITIEYCKVNEIDFSKDDFFNKQFEELENNIDNYPMYKFLRKEIKLDVEKVKELSSFQFKLYVIAPKGNGKKNENIVIHDNMYLNVKTRIPLARNSSVYLYNIYYDCSKINYKMITKDIEKQIKSKYPKIVALSTFGPMSLNRSYVKVENCIFNGVKHKYTFFKDWSLESIGKIVIKQDKYVLENLKNNLESKVGTFKFN